MDPYRYLSFTTRKVMRAWAEREQPVPLASWEPLNKPLDRCKVALLTTAGVAMHGDEPFDQQGERDNPWWGDPTWRDIHAHATEADVAIYHLHIDPTPAEADLDVVLPLRRLRELAAQGVIGAASSRHFSIMGYILDATELVNTSAVEIAQELAADDVDLVLLIPV